MRVGHFVEQIEVEPDFRVLPAEPDGSPDSGGSEPAPDVVPAAVPSSEDGEAAVREGNPPKPFEVRPTCRHSRFRD